MSAEDGRYGCTNGKTQGKVILDYIFSLLKCSCKARLSIKTAIVSEGTLLCHEQSQYDRMVEEKDAELEENKRKEMEAVSSRTSLVCC